MQYKIKAPETLAVRHSSKCEQWTDGWKDGHRYDNTLLDDRGRRGGKKD